MRAASADQGPLQAALSRLPDRRAMVLTMGKPVSFLLLTGAEADAFVAGVRSRVAMWFGRVSYDGAGLARYVRCQVLRDRCLVRVVFEPASAVGVQGALAANPEVFMALADVLEAAKQRLPAMRGAPARGNPKGLPL